VQHRDRFPSGTNPQSEPGIRRCYDHIEMFRAQSMPPVAPDEPVEEEEDLEEIEGVSELDSEHRDSEPNPQNDDSSSGSAFLVGNLDDF
jgi:hypothetical protein